jgi:hypothetical protein
MNVAFGSKICRKYIHNLSMVGLYLLQVKRYKRSKQTDLSDKGKEYRIINCVQASSQRQNNKADNNFIQLFS